VFDERGNFKELLARLHDLDGARAAYTACRAKYPAKIIYLCPGGRTLRRSDRTNRLHQFRLAVVHYGVIANELNLVNVEMRPPCSA
jgi:hypothetical protein